MIKLTGQKQREKNGRTKATKGQEGGSKKGGRGRCTRKQLRAGRRGEEGGRKRSETGRSMAHMQHGLPRSHVSVSSVAVGARFWPPSVFCRWRASRRVQAKTPYQRIQSTRTTFQQPIPVWHVSLSSRHGQDGEIPLQRHWRLRRAHRSLILRAC